MLYYSNNARKSHIKRITELIEVINTTPIKYLGGYQNTIDITKYLINYKELIEKELKEETKNGDQKH